MAMVNVITVTFILKLSNNASAVSNLVLEDGDDQQYLERTLALIEANLLSNVRN